jgi:hypothetical protein
MTDDTPQVTVSGNGFTIKFDLTNMLDAMCNPGRYGYDPEADEEVYEGPHSLRDEIVLSTATLLTKSLRGDIQKQINDAVRERVLAEVTEMVRDGLVNGTLQRTDEWGRTQGDPKPLIDIIRETAIETLEKKNGDTYGRNKETMLQKLVRDQVTLAFTKELQAEVDRARAEAKKAIHDQAAAVISETIDRARRNLL